MSNRLGKMVLAVTIVVAIWLGGMAAGRFTAEAEPVECVRGTFLAPSEWGLVAIAEQSICGRGLRYSPIGGPGELR